MTTRGGEDEPAATAVSTVRINRYITSMLQRIGNDAVAKFVEGLSKRVKNGEFSLVNYGCGRIIGSGAGSYRLYLRWHCWRLGHEPEIIWLLL